MPRSSTTLGLGLKAALGAFWVDLKGSIRDLAPIILVIVGFHSIVLGRPLSELTPIAPGALFIVIGLTCFIFGLKTALYPMGEGVAHALAKASSVPFLLVFAFALGFGTTFAEPALIAVAKQAAAVAASEALIASNPDDASAFAFWLRFTVATSVGCALMLGVVRIIRRWSLPIIIIGGYILVLLITLAAPREIIGIAYDAGGVTTSTVTVPLVAALGVGLASSLRNRNPMMDGFGLIAFASLLPVGFVLIYGLVLTWI